jgi:hypothetical protein
MYHNEVCFTNAILKRPIGPSSKDTMTSARGLFAKVFVLGQKYQLPRLENDAIDAIVTYWESEDFTLGIAPWSYKYTSDGCGICRLIIRIAKHDMDHGDFNRLKGKLYIDFLFDMNALFLKDRQSEVSFKTVLKAPDSDVCSPFHTHQEGKYTCRRAKTYTVIPDDA